jgi:hypothetical protein
MVGKAPSIYKHEDAEIMVNSVSSVLGWIVIDKRERGQTSQCAEGAKPFTCFPPFRRRHVWLITVY